MKLFKDADPAGEALTGGIPAAVFFWQQSPLSAGAGDPEGGGEGALALPMGADLDFRTGAEERQDLLPLLIGECYLSTL